MRFYFNHDDVNLRRPAPQGGCGVTDEELLAIQVWQMVHSYQFEFHLENHGPYVYIFPDGRAAGQRRMPRYYFGGGRVGTFDNDGDLQPGVKRDVKAVVDGNRDLFGRMHERFFGPGDVARAPVESVRAPALAYFSCINPACPDRDQLFAVKFASRMEMNRQIRTSNIGGIRSAEYPVIRCERRTCGLAMELFEYPDNADEAPRIKGTIDFED